MDFWRITIVIGGIEPLAVDKILIRYIEIGSIEPFVVDKILSIYIGIGNVEPLVVDILSFCGVRGEVLWGEVLVIEADTDLNRVMPFKNLKSLKNISYYYLIIIF